MHFLHIIGIRFYLGKNVYPGLYTMVCIVCNLKLALTGSCVFRCVASVTHFFIFQSTSMLNFPTEILENGVVGIYVAYLSGWRPFNIAIMTTEKNIVFTMDHTVIYLELLQRISDSLRQVREKPPMWKIC